MKVKLTIILIYLVLFLLLPGINPGYAAETSMPECRESIEEINKQFRNPHLNIKKFIEKFEADGREVFKSREQIVDALKIKPGSYIADVGTGTGIFIEGFSKAAGKSGWLFAVDISSAFLNHSRRFAETKDISNISFVLNTDSSVCLPPQSVDLIFLCNTYHHITDIENTMKSIYAALKPEGRFVIIDFDKKNASREWIRHHIKKDADTVRKELESMKFKFVDSISLKQLTENYFLIFKK